MCSTFHTKEYRLSDTKVDDGVKDILRERDWAKKLAGLRSNPHPQAQFPVGGIPRCVPLLRAATGEHRRQRARPRLRRALGFRLGQRPVRNLAGGAGWQQVAGWIAVDIAAGKAMASTPCPWAATRPHRRAYTARFIRTRLN